MAVPGIIAREYYLLDGEINRRHQEIMSKYDHIAAVDSKIQEVGLVADALNSMVAAIKSIQKQDNDDCEELKNRMHKELDNVYDLHYKNYIDLLIQRGIVSNRTIVVLDEETKKEMLKNFNDKLIDLLASFHDEVEEINPSKDLKTLESQLNDRYEKQKQICEELFEEKTIFTSETLDLNATYEEEINALEVVKAKLLLDAGCG